MTADITPNITRNITMNFYVDITIAMAKRNETVERKTLPISAYLR